MKAKEELDTEKIRSRLYSLLKDTASKKISVELFIDAFVPLFASYAEEVLSEEEYKILDEVFQEAPYFIPVIFLKPENYVFLDVRGFRKLVMRCNQNLKNLKGSTRKHLYVK
ncbi:hypothetical protein ACFL35_05485 [Candidatus Riflebacteria bacterium]